MLGCYLHPQSLDFLVLKTLLCGTRSDSEASEILPRPMGIWSVDRVKSPHSSRGQTVLLQSPIHSRTEKGLQTVASGERVISLPCTNWEEGNGWFCCQTVQVVPWNMKSTPLGRLGITSVFMIYSLRYSDSGEHKHGHGQMCLSWLTCGVHTHSCAAITFLFPTGRTRVVCSRVRYSTSPGLNTP